MRFSAQPFLFFVGEKLSENAPLLLVALSVEPFRDQSDVKAGDPMQTESLRSQIAARNVIIPVEQCDGEKAAWPHSDDFADALMRDAKPVRIDRDQCLGPLHPLMQSGPWLKNQQERRFHGARY